MPLPIPSYPSYIEYADITVTDPSNVAEIYTVLEGTWYMISCRVTGGGGGGGAGDVTDGKGGGGGGQSNELLNDACSVLLTGGDIIEYFVGAGGARGSSIGEDGHNGVTSSIFIKRDGNTLISFESHFGSGGKSGSNGGAGGAGGDGGEAGGNGSSSGGGRGGGTLGLETIGIGGGGGGIPSEPGVSGNDGEVHFVIVKANVMGPDADLFVALASNICTINSSVVYGDVGSFSGTTVLNATTLISPSVVLDGSNCSGAVSSSLATHAFLLDSNIIPVVPYLEDNTGYPLGTYYSTLSAGVYTWRGHARINETFTLDGPGLYVFQAINDYVYTTDSGTWTSETSVDMKCINGAHPKDVYFVSTSDISINPTASSNTILGNFIAGGNIVVSGPTTNIFSRFQAPAGSVTIGQVEFLAPPSSFCYAKGTKILTTRGYVAIEDIQTDDLVVTKGVIDDDGNVQDSEESAKAVTYVGKFVMSSLGKHSYPVCFKAGSLGTNTPFEDLVVSPNHAILIHGRKTSANWFINNDTVYSMSHLNTMEYYLIELTEHSVIVANGILSESFLGDRNAFVTVCKNESLIASMLPVA